ncbi:MAG: hypothetical protein HYR73_09240 [Candidatus Eisenbacteria bacterium]|nr:hypothetical protein [Candidatus Eisenbacteria bacterium]
MQRARTFFFVSAGILMLALAYHFGATSATAQIAGQSLVGGSWEVAYAANGNVYLNRTASSVAGPWVLAENVFSGGPTPAQHESFGQLKVKYR